MFHGGRIVAKELAVVRCQWLVVRCALFHQLFVSASVFNLSDANNGRLTTDNGQIFFVTKRAGGAS
jgi:hypothetical protein